jgi:hypothetical protein
MKKDMNTTSSRCSICCGNGAVISKVPFIEAISPMGIDSEESRFLHKWLMIQERKQQYHHLKLQTEEFCSVINRYLPKPSESLSLDTVRSDHQKLLDEKSGIEHRLQKAGEKDIKFMRFNSLTH